MGNTIFIKEKRVCVKPMQSRLEAIQKLKPPMNQKGCWNFTGIVNFVSIFCPELQKLLKPIYELTKRVDHSFGEINNKGHLMKSRIGY